MKRTTLNLTLRIFYLKNRSQIYLKLVVTIFLFLGASGRSFGQCSLPESELILTIPIPHGTCFSGAASISYPFVFHGCPDAITLADINGPFQCLEMRVVDDMGNVLPLFDWSVSHVLSSLSAGTHYLQLRAISDCTEVYLIQQGRSIVSQDLIGDITTSCPPLPVTLLRFVSSTINHQIILTWETATEINNAYFYIEHSRDGKDWTQVAQVSGKGISQINQSYQWIDHSPDLGFNYYRLSQEDYDGSITYHQIISVDMIKSESDLLIYPNPFTDLLHIHTSDAGAYIISDAKGVIVNNGELDGASQIDLRALTKGLYFISISQDEQVDVRRIVKE